MGFKRGNPGIGHYTVHGPVIGRSTLPVNTELPVIEVVSWGHQDSRRGLDECLEASAIHRQVLCKLPICDRAHRCGFGIDERRAACDGDCCGKRADAELKIKHTMILDVKFHVGFYDEIETFLLYKNAVDGRLKTRNDVNTCFVCLCGSRHVGEHVYSLYLDFGYWKPVGVGDAAAEFGVGGLSKGERSTEAHPQRRNNQNCYFGADSHSMPPQNWLTPV